MVNENANKGGGMMNPNNRFCSTINNQVYLFAVILSVITMMFISGCDRSNSSTPAALTKIEVTQPTNDPLLVELQRQFTATGIYSNSTKKDLTNEVAWNSDDPNVLAFSSETKGLATANSVGSANVTATLGSVNSAVLAVTTKAPGSPIGTIPPEGRVEINPADLPALPAQLPVRLSAHYIETGGSSTDITQTATWSSSDKTIGTVSDKGVFTGVATGTVTISATEVTKNVTGQLQITVDTTTVLSISSEPESVPTLPVDVRYRVKFIAFLTPSNERIDISSEMEITSADQNIIEVLKPEKEPGAVYLWAKSAGTAKVTATLPGTTVSFEQDITAAKAVLDSLRVSPSSPVALPVGLTAQFQAVGGYAIEGVQDTQEFDISHQVIFSSSDESKATISNADDSYGLATGIATGSTNIKATATTGQVSNTVPLSVSAAVLTGISTEPLGNITIPLSARTLQFKVTGNYSDGSSKDITDTASYYSDDTSIASFDQKDRPGLLILDSTGSTALVMFKDIHTVAKALTVSGSSIQSVAITGPGNLNTIPVGSTLQLTATADYGSDGTWDITLGCSWSTSDPAKGTFSSTPGELTAKAEGTFNVICFADGKQWTQSVTVVGSSGLTTGTWKGTGICFNVSADRSKLTSLGSTCPDGGSLVVTSLAGTIEGTSDSCVVNILHKDDLNIALEKTFAYDFTNGSAGREFVTGEFSSANAASGSATLETFTPTSKCKGNWTAAPE